MSRELLRCKCGQLFRTEHLPEELLAAHKRLAENDKTKDKIQKPVEKSSKSLEEFEIRSDADMEDVVADKDLDPVRKNLE